MKKIKIFGIIIIIYVIFNMFWPKNIITITDTQNKITHAAHLRIHHKHSIFEVGTTVESDNIDDINKLLSFFKTYKCVLDPRYGHKDFDNKESYAISIITTVTNPNTHDRSKKELFYVCTKGDGHIRLTSKYGITGYYKIINDKLDLKFLEHFFNSLSKENGT